MSSDDASDKECPLCMEAFDIDDFNFFPCNCQYQICRFCWHRIRTNENGLCPACRQSYPEDPVNFQPLSSAEVHKIKTEKKQKVLQQKNKVIEDRKHLSEYRVLQKNLVYAVGISQRMANPELLKKPEFFGKFGKILKIAVGTAQAINNSTPPTHTAYVTYARCEDALRAIQAVNNMVVEGRLLKASLGTTKYCSSFLKGQTCYKPECMYLHEVADEKISFTKEDMHQGKHTEYERRLLEHMFALFGIQGPTGFNQQQTSTGRELVARNRARVMTTGDSMEKKRPTSGSVENLPRISSQQIKQKKGSSTILTQQPLTTKEGNNTILWEPRRASETRELYRNEPIGQSDIVVRNSKTLKKSISPLVLSNGMTRGGDDSSNVSSDGSVNFQRNTSPESLSFPIGEEIHHHQHVNKRSESDPPVLKAFDSSPSPQINLVSSNNTSEFDRILLTNLTINGDSQNNVNHFEKQNQQQMLQNNKMSTSTTFASQNVIQQQPSNSSAVNFFIDDDDLGFDPFEESAKALKEIMQEEKKHFVVPPSQPVYMNGDKYNISSSNHATENSLYTNTTTNNNNHHHPSLYTQPIHRQRVQQQQHSMMPMMTSMPGLQQNYQQNFHSNYQNHQHGHQQHQQGHQQNFQQNHQNFHQQNNNFGINYGSTTTNEGLIERQNNNNHNTWLPVPPGFSPRSSTGSGF
uniref:CCR4-NOT transcription complex subunit 4 n=1 Tax=Meloidogyne hapla TaxID=6305 RepID=A0A1I8AY95_MELHA